MNVKPDCRRRAAKPAILAIGLAFAAVAALAARPLSAHPAPPPLASFSALPLSFEPAPPGAPADTFLARGLNYQFMVTPGGARLELARHSRVTAASPLDRSPAPGGRTDSAREVGITLLGANQAARVTGASPLPGRINYLIGADPSRHRVGVPTFARVQVDQVYPGIDLAYYGNQQQLEYDFTIGPGANPADIALRFDGVDHLQITPAGDLVLALGGDEIHQARPVVYQTVNGVRRPVPGGYRLRDEHTVVFQPGAYDRSLPLTIDPTLTYSSYFGGNSADIAWSVKVSPVDGSIYLAGQTLSSDFPFNAPDGFGGPTNHGGRFNGDGFVAKLDATGTNLIFFTYLGGEQDEAILDLALDGNGNAYVTGYTSSTNFPVYPATGIPGLASSTNISGALTPARLYFSDAFVAEIKSDGSGLVFSGFLGGSQRDSGIGICLDPANYIYVTGYTYSTNFPVKSPVVALPLGAGSPITYNSLSGSNDVFVTKFSPAGSGVVYSTYLGGTNFDVGQGIAADRFGNAFVTGYTCSTNFPVTAALSQLTGQLNNTTNTVAKYHGVRVPQYDAFVAKIGPLGGDLIYSVYLGGTNNDSGFRVKVDPAGAAYVCGSTTSAEFPMVPVLMTNFYTLALTNNSTLNSDAFLVKIVESNKVPALQYSVHFGGTGDEIAWDLAINAATTNIVVAGTTTSTNFVTYLNSNTNLPFLDLTNVIRSNDVFVATFSPAPFPVTTPIYILSNNIIVGIFYQTVTNSILTNLYTAALGGLREDDGFGVDIDPANNVYVVGQTYSVEFPTLNPIQPNVAGHSDAFLARIQMADSVASVTVDTSPAGLQILVDGTQFTSPFTTNWVYGSTHSIFAPRTQTNAPGTQVTWTSWSNGGAISNLVIPAASPLHLTARFATQYWLTTAAAGPGAVSPAPGWYGAGSNVSVTAIAASGASFTGWTASGAGSSTVGNPATVEMDGPVSQTANFSGSPADKIVIVAQGPGTVSTSYPPGATLTPGRTYSLTAVPLANGTFTGWTGSLPAPDQTISFVMTNGLVFQANFITNPFPALAGSYTGLFFDTNAVPYEISWQSAGPFSATVSPNGSFTASFRVSNGSYSCSGTFANGTYTTVIPRSSPLMPLEVSLTLSPTSPGRITGYVSGYAWTSPVQADQAAYSSTSPAPQAGERINLRIPGNPESLVEAGGDGFATLQVTPNGMVSVVGKLGDGTALSQSASLSSLNRFPLYSSLYGGKGQILGWVYFGPGPGFEPAGQILWTRPAHPTSWFYPGGFALSPAADGSAYVRTNASPLPGLASGRIIIENGGLLHNITNTFTLAGSELRVAASTNRISLSIGASSGLIQGSFFDTESRRTMSLYGAVFQGQTNGSGYFLNTNQTGRVWIGR